LYSEKEMLFYAVDSGMIDIATIQMLIEMNEKKKISRDARTQNLAVGRWRVENLLAR